MMLLGDPEIHGAAELVALAPCLPPPWARNGHVQTLLGHFLASPPMPAGGERVEIALPDGDALVARLWSVAGSRAVIHFFHGLGGELASAYMRRSAARCLRAGLSVMLVNHRGRGEGKALARAPYHSGRAEDLGAAIALGRARFPGQAHLAIGYSLSGNALLLLLSGRRGAAPPDAAIAVNAPINLARSARLLQKGFNRVYDLRFVYDCRRDILERQSRGWLDRSIRISPWATLEQLDEAYTAPQSGFRDRAHYYETCSTHEALREIRVPTLVLTAQDDPFVPFSEYRAASLSPAVAVRAERYGGHMGYLTAGAGPLGLSRWLDDAVDAGIAALLRRIGASAG